MFCWFFWDGSEKRRGNTDGINKNAGRKKQLEQTKEQKLVGLVFWRLHNVFWISRGNHTKIVIGLDLH